MKLTRAEFDARYKAGRLRIALVGMSNIGKSYTGTRLASQYNFSLIEVDKLIWEELGQDSMADFAAWQGQPYTQGYAEREAKSIALESAATRKALSLPVKNALLDTTGSVIYTDKAVLSTLKDTHYVIHISASSDAINRLKKSYFKNPKPLVWAGHYKRIEGKTEDESIMSCYPDLLAARAKAYAQLADHTLDSRFILNPKIKVSEIFKALKPAR